MPELPDIVVYIEALEKRIQGSTLERVRVASPFLLRTAVPPLSSVEGKKIVELRRLGKRICFGLEGDLWLVLHLMIAGRLHWYDERAKAARVRSVAVFEFSTGSLTLTEAGTQKRASLHVLQGEARLDDLNPGGLEVFDASTEEFARAIRAKNHTLKRALTDPRILSGIGNAYSDEILFDARLSPFTLTQKLSDEEVERLFAAIKRTLTEWLERLRAEATKSFPEKVTAFRPDMATHGKYGQPCPRCGSKIQRIRYGSNETNYCPTCQTGGRLLADRALSRLLKDDWPRTPEELENTDKRRLKSAD
ncbi:MAG TPA: DNA-formamidopyrimidine glycosylase family protein [Pyrinomonadaceae bacterium]|nr:DNA-formamidopyrimidine glycosylase family protein [Pyrinomonadaceae bacterium]